MAVNFGDYGPNGKEHKTQHHIEIQHVLNSVIIWRIILQFCSEQKSARKETNGSKSPNQNFKFGFGK